ncbi:MAG: hypothetical protein R3C28_03060 [Pirellulaceae bacterium]
MLFNLNWFETRPDNRTNCIYLKKLVEFCPGAAKNNAELSPAPDWFDGGALVEADVCDSG